MRLGARLGRLLAGAIATLLVVILFPALGHTATERRVALVMGVGAYQNATRLPNPTNDARAMAAKLEGLGFEVVEALDPDQTRLRAAISTFAARLEGAAAGLFFYAGHGIQVDGQNYLIPVEAKLERAADLYVQAVNLADVLRVMEATVPVRLVFLDACRDNPLARRLARSLGATRSQAIGQGLARVDAADGTLIVYATAPGDVAEDGEGRNSPFTAALLQHLDTPGLEVAQVLRRVRASVLAATARRQVPWESSSLTGDFYFNAMAGEAPGPSLGQLDLAFWEQVKASPDPADLEEYLRRFPSGQYAGLARNRLEALKQQQAALVPPRVTDVPQAPIEPAVGMFERPSGALAPGSVFRDCPVCPELVVVPAGEFVMGSPPGEERREPDEGPQRRVTIAQPFAVGRHELTFAEWDACVAEGGCSHRPEAMWGRGRQPVIRVSWDDVQQQYLPWLRRKTGRPFRLPSEAEWEYAARAGTSGPFSFGTTITTALANYYGETTYGAGPKGVYRERTAEVGSFAANGFGLHDLHGNVWEWVEDRYAATYEGAPADGSVRLAGQDPRRVMRGGSWSDDPWVLRAAFRSKSDPGNRSNGIGFRVVRNLDP